jgi:hypothetical protein
MRGMKTALACFALLVSAACLLFVVWLLVAGVIAYRSGDLTVALDADAWAVIGLLSLIAVVGITGLCLGLSLLAKSRIE